jgi:hypothetical protein
VTCTLQIYVHYWSVDDKEEAKGVKVPDDEEPLKFDQGNHV